MKSKLFLFVLLAFASGVDAQRGNFYVELAPSFGVWQRASFFFVDFDNNGWVKGQYKQINYISLLNTSIGYKSNSKFYYEFALGAQAFYVERFSKQIDSFIRPDPKEIVEFEGSGIYGTNISTVRRTKIFPTIDFAFGLRFMTRNVISVQASLWDYTASLNHDFDRVSLGIEFGRFHKYVADAVAFGPSLPTNEELTSKGYPQWVEESGFPHRNFICSFNLAYNFKSSGKTKSSKQSEKFGDTPKEF
jgi:hypothetical protein